MIPHHAYLLVRAGSVYVTVALLVAAWACRRPTRRALCGAILAFCWNLPALLLLHLAAARLGWWRIDARGGLLLGMPVDMYLGWACLWGPVPALAFRALPLGVVVVAAFAFDAVVMPAAFPVLRLEHTWLIGEVVGLLAVLVPGLVLARWTERDEHLAGRTALQVVAFTGLLLFLLPAIAIDGSGTGWVNPLDRPRWQIGLIAQALALPAVVGLSAVQEFVTRGQGSPVPFDPPRRLVSTGVYAYLRNPMQLSAMAVLFVLGFALRNSWVAAAGVMSHFYAAGLAGWDEDEDLRRRFGERWLTYRRGVRRVAPRWRPFHPPDSPPGRLFVAGSCRMCREVARWFERRAPRQLAIVPAEWHPQRALTRITYEPADGTRASTGVEAVARALEHVHFGWALVGCALRLPGICRFAQLLADASGAEPRTIGRALPEPGPMAARRLTRDGCSGSRGRSSSDRTFS